jgi:hypothetical protein
MRKRIHRSMSDLCGRGRVMDTGWLFSPPCPPVERSEHCIRRPRTRGLSPTKLPRGTLHTDPQCRSDECVAAKGKNNELTLFSQLGPAEPNLRAPDRVPHEFLGQRLDRMHCYGERCSALRVEVGILTTCCAPGDEACVRARHAFGLCRVRVRASTT